VIKRIALVGVLLSLLGCPGDTADGGKTDSGGKTDGGGETDGGGGGKAPGKFAQGMQEWAKTQLGALPDVAENPANPLSEEKVDLGRMLYFDTRMSASDISCNTCHELTAWGIDAREDNAVSMGHEGQKGNRNSPTVYNAAFHTSQFWDGREPDVERQAIQPLINPVEHAMADHDAVVANLKAVAGYEPLFKAAFPEDDDPITIENVGKAIGAFERLLVTNNSPFDAFVGGDFSALTEEQIEGIGVYKNSGCITCHAGPSLGGNMKQKLGFKTPYKVDGKVHPDNGTEFKVPGLRNVAKTGPYLHDGSQADLTAVVKAMAEHQASSPISDDDAKKLVAFLESLTGTPDEDFIKKPELPQ